MMKLNYDFAMSVETILYLASPRVSRCESGRRAEKKSSGFVQCKEIANELNFSLGYLQKVTQTLGRFGIVECKRGRIGGVKLKADVITLLDLWRATCGNPDFTDPPIAEMKKPLKAFKDSLAGIVIYRKK